MKQRLVVALGALAVLGSHSLPVASQGNQGGDVAGSDRGSGTAKGRQAIVGANTTAGTTTGSSGAAGDSGGGPTAPSEDLCRDYSGTPAHADCLAKVTKR